MTPHVALASLVPSYRGHEPRPHTKPPPWTNTITGLEGGAGSPGLAPTQTLTYRQSSVVEATPKSDDCCGQGDAAADGRGVVHGAGGAGGFHRSEPCGGAA